MKFKEFSQLDENIVAILNPLIGNDHSPFSASDMITALRDARLDKDPGKIKTAIKMLDTLFDYVTTLSTGKSKITLSGIENVKKMLQTALKEFE